MHSPSAAAIFLNAGFLSGAFGWEAAFLADGGGSLLSTPMATNESFSPRAHRVACAPRLCCVSGIGRVQLDSKQVQEVHLGDTAMIPPDTRHWYGAAPDRIFVHLAMSEVNDQREGTAWFEKVTDGDYGKPTASAK